MAKKSNKKKGNKPALSATVIEENTSATVNNDKQEEEEEDDEVSIKTQDSTQEHVEGKEVEAPVDQISELQAEIQELKQTITRLESLPTEQSSKDSLEKLESQLQTVTEERDKFSSQYEALLGRISSMKTIFTKMKESQIELEQVKNELEEMKLSKETLQSEVKSLKKNSEQDKESIELLRNESIALNSECDRLTSDLTTLRSSNSSELNNLKSQILSNGSEIKDLLRKIDQLNESNEELQIIIDNDKIIMKDLNEQILSLSETKMESSREILKLSNERENLLSELQQFNLSKRQIEESFKSKHLQQQDKITSLITQLENLTDQNSELKLKFQEKQTLLDQLEPQLHEKTLLLNKSRHESVILNEHLTKALQLIKKSSAIENTIDKELISNLIISFVTLQRGDTKKFEVLSLIAGFLGWDKDQRVQVGLSHESNKSESTIRESNEAKGISGKMGSFVSLWTEFLENESTSSGKRVGG